MALLDIVSTEGVAPADRLALWGDLVWRLVGGLQSDAFGDACFHGRIAHGRIGALGVCKLEASRHRVVRTPQLIRRSDRAYLKVVAQLRGRACFEQRGRRTWLSPGQWSVYDTAESYAVSNPVEVEQLVLMVPKDLMPARDYRLDELVVQRFSSEAGVARMAFDAFGSALAAAPDLDGAVADGTADVLMQLVHLSLLERSGRDSAVTRREAFRDRVRAQIARRLRDPELSVEQLARALNCSKRLLHGAFEGEGETLGAYVLARRLEACRRELRAAAGRQRSVTEIALSWGFSSPAHFSRAYRRRFGLAPSEERARPVGQPEAVEVKP